MLVYMYLCIYRHAVDVNGGTDYRAWYGLGQTYEMLHLYQYSLYYYKKATTLKSNDARMWCAVGNCYSKLSMKLMAIQTLNHAVSCGDREGVATRELARLYREAGQVDLAAECYRRHLQASSTTDEMPGGSEGVYGSELQGMGMYMEGDEGQQGQQGLSGEVLAHYLSPSTEVTDNSYCICVFNAIFRILNKLYIIHCVYTYRLSTGSALRACCSWLLTTARSGNLTWPRLTALGTPLY